VPGNVAAATGAVAGEVSLSWSASTDTDGTGVAGYRVYRDGVTTKIAEVTTGTSYTDSGLTPGSSHSYTVSAFDAANLESAKSASSSATAGAATGANSVTVPAVADATVDGSVPTTNAGSAKTLRVDNSPVVSSYLRFSPQGLAGSLTSATLSVYANSSLTAGFQVCTVTDNTWTETGVTASNAPAPDCSKAVVAKPAVAGSRLTIDVTSLMTSANGDVTFVFVGVSPTALSLGSRESTTPPQLTVGTTG
jgi:hypothetical protein